MTPMPKENFLKGYRLLHEGALALAEATSTGMCIDVPYCLEKVAELDSDMSVAEKALMGEDFGKAWVKKYGTRMSVRSDTQLQKLLYKEWGLAEPNPDGSCPVDKEALEPLTDEHPFIKYLLEYRWAKKTHSFLAQILREQVDGTLHPQFNLHTATTFRSSSEAPNFQNLPKRDPTMMHAVRRGIKPRPGRVLVELDYSGLEVRIACCYHQDPNMVQMLETGYDMHKAWAGKCFLIDEDSPHWGTKEGKAVRFSGKNGFVFPEFYGDYWGNCSKTMWYMIDESGLKGPDGVPMKEWLSQFGITQRESASASPLTRQPSDEASFDHHIANLEREFWDDTFPVYRDWKPAWFKEYQKNGYIDLKTGFRIEGAMSQKDVNNYPVQGAAFHCLLWSFIRLQKALRQYKMHSLLIGQIHDSIVGDVTVGELHQYIDLAEQIMTVDIRKDWKWIIVPLGIEAEASAEGGDFSTLEEVHKVA